MIDDNIKKAFEEVDKAFKSAEIIFNQSIPSSSKSTKSEITKINFTTKRWNTFRKLSKCAIQMLFTGKTSLVVATNKKSS